MMQPASQFQFMSQLSSSGQCLPPPQPIYCLPDKVGKPSPQHYEARKSKEQLLQQPAQNKTEPRRIPRLRAVVESQAFKNILVDEMDMMLSRAATLIQANWRGYRLRQKLISQMMAAKAIQEAWRRFSTRRLLRSSKATVKKVSKEEGDIPYHPPQQVRFQPPEEKSLPVQPVMMSKETQFPSSDSLATCAPQLTLLQHPAVQGMPEPGMQVPHGPGTHGVAFLPQQTLAIRLPSPVSLDSKCQPCLLTKTIRSACLIRHIEGDTVKTKHVTARTTKAGAPEPPALGRYGQAVPGPCKTPTQAHVEAETHKTPPQAFPASTLSKAPPKTYPLVSITRTQAQVCPMSTVTKSSPQTCPGPMTVMKTLPQTCPPPTVTKTQAQMRPAPSLTNAPLQTRIAATMAKIPPQVCLLASVIRPPPPARPVAATARPPPQTCPVSAMTKPAPQMRLMSTPTKTQMQTCQAATVPKTPSQICPGVSMMKPPPQTRLAAMITKTPAQIRSVAAVLRTLCLVPPMVGNLRAPPQTAGAAGIPNTSSNIHLSAPKAKVMMNMRQATGIVKGSSHSYLAEGKVRCVAPPHLEAGAPKPMARGPLEPEKIKTCLQRQVKRETVSKTNMAMEMTRPSSWTKVAEDRSKPPPPAQQRIEIIKVQSQVYVPVEAAAALPRAQLAAPLTKTLCQARPSTRQAKALLQEQLATPLTKTLSQVHPATEQAKALSQQAHLATCPPTAMPQPQLATRLMKTTSQVHLSAEQTKVLSQTPLSTHLTKALPQPQLTAQLMPTSPVHSPAKQTKAMPQAHLAVCSAKTPSQVCPPSRLTKTPSLAHLVTCLTKTQSQVHLTTGAMKVQSQAQLPIGLTKTQSQAQLVTQTTKSLYAAHQPVDLHSKTQSQPLLTGSKVSALPCQHLGVLSPLPRAKPDDRATQLQSQGHMQGKTMQGPCPVASEAQGMLVPLMTSTGHPTCNVESWGDSGTTRAQPPMASQPVPCQEAAAASQIASLCAELAAVLGSQEDIRALLAKALSQGEVRAALNQALSKDVLGTTMTKAMPQGMLGMALVKALSWGELGITLSRALSRGELRSELTKVMQGKLAEVLSKALTDEERAALGQALCQGELGAVLSQSLSQAALRTGAILPKATSKTVGSGMTLLPASAEVDCRGSPSAAWGSAVGLGRPQPSKVRVSQVGGWEDFTMGQPAGLLEEMGDGATLEGLPCSSLLPVAVSLTRRMVPSIYQYPLVVGLDLMQPWERGPRRVSYLRPRVRKGSVCLTPRAGTLALDGSPAARAQGPHLPKPSHVQPPPRLWQSFIANGIGPSTSQPSVACGNAPSSHRPHVVSRVTSQSWTSSGEGSGALGTLPGGMGGRRAVQSQPSFPTCRDAACWCKFSGVSKVSPKHSHRSVTRGSNQPSKATGENLRRTQPPSQKQVFQDSRQMVSTMTSSSLRTTVVSRVHIPKCPAGGNLFQGPPGTRLGRGLPWTPASRQKGNLTRNPRPREHVTSHQMSLLNQLVSGLPQHPHNVLAKNLSPGSMVSRPNDSESQSSLQSCSSPSFSAMSVASLTTVELVDKAQEGISDQDPQVDSLPSQEDKGTSQRLTDMEKLERESPQHTIPNLCWHSSAAPELTPVLCRGPVSSHLTLNVHWDSQDEKDRLSPGQSSMDLVERVSQETFRPGLRRSLSLGTVVPTEHQQPSLATKLALTQSQPALVGRVALNLAKSILSQPLGASKLTRSLSQPTVSTRVPSSRAQPSATARLAPSLPQSRVGGRVFLVIPNTSSTSEVASGTVCTSGTGGDTSSSAPPSVSSEVAPRSRHSSAASRVSTSLVPTAVTSGVDPAQSHLADISGVTPDLAQTPLATGVSPNLAQTSMAIGVSLNFAQPSMDSGVSPSLAQPSIASGLSSNPAQPSIASGLSSNPAQPSTGTEISPSVAQPTIASEVSPSFVQPSMDNRLFSSPTQPPMASGVSPSFVKPCMISGGSPSLTQPSMDSRVSPSLAQPSLAPGVSPSLPHPSMASGVTPSLAQPSMATGTSPHLAQPSVVCGMSPSLGQSSMVSEMSPHLAQPSLSKEVSPGLPHALVTSALSPTFAQSSVSSGVTQSPAQPCMASGVSPRPPQRSTAHGVVLKVSQPSMAIGMSLSLAHPSAAHGVSPNLGQPSMVSGMSPSPPHQSMASGMAPSLTQPVASGVPPSPSQRSIARGLAPGASQPPMANGVSSTFAQPSMTSGVSPSLPHQPMASGVSPSLPHQPMASGVSQIPAQPSVASGMSPRPPYQSTAYGVAPSLAQSFMDSGVSPSLAHLCMAMGMSPSLVHPSMTSGVSPSLAHSLMACGLSPILSQRPMASHVAPSPAHLSMASGVSPSFAQPFMASGVPPSFIHPSMTSGMPPYLAQPSVACGVPPILAQPFMANRASPGFGQPPVPWGVSQGLAQPSMATGISPSLGHPSMVSGGYPILSHQPTASGVAPSLIQTPSPSPAVPRLAHSFLAPGTSPLLSQASMANLGSMSLSQPSMATGLACGLSQPSVIYGVGRGPCESTPGPRVDPTLQASRVSAGAPGLCHPSVFISLGSGRSYPCVPSRMGLGLHQPSLDMEMGACEDPVMRDRMVSNLQDSQFNKVSLGFHQPSSICGRHPMAISVSAPNLYQTDVSKEGTQGPSVFHPTWLKGMSACSPQGPTAAGMLLSLSQGATPTGLAGSIFQKNTATSMGPGQCQAADGLISMASQALETGVSLTHEDTSMATGMEPSASHAAVPNRLDARLSTLSIYNLGPRPTQVSVPLPMPSDHQLPAVATVVPSSYPYASIFPEGSVMGTARGSLASSSIDRPLTPATVSNAVANYMACSLSRGSVVRGVGQSLSPGSPVTGVAQSRPLDPMASGMAHSLPIGTGAGSLAPSQTAALGAEGKRLRTCGGPLASFTAPGLPPGLVADGVCPNMPFGSMKSGAQNLSQGSMIIGLTPRPYHGAGEGPAALPGAPRATGPVQVIPQASGAQSTTKGQYRVPTALSRASPFSQDPGMMTFGTIDDPTKFKQRDLGEALSQESGSNRKSNKSKVLEVTPWTYQSPMEDYVDSHGGLPHAEEMLPQDQMPQLGEGAPSPAGGMAPVVPFQVKHSLASSFSTILQSDSASSGCPPSPYLIATSRVRSMQMGSAVDRAMSQPLAPGVCEDLSALQPESMAYMGPPSQGTLASDILLIPPHLAPGSPMASSLHPGSVARMESPCPLQRSGTSSAIPRVQPYQSSMKKAVSGHSQTAAVTSTFQKPVSGNLTQTGHKSLRPKKYYRFIHGKLIPELLEGSMTKVVPSNQMQRQETPLSLGSHRQSPGQPWVGRTPAVHSGDAAHGPSVPRLAPGVRRVSLGYTSSPSGLWRPLLEQDSHDSMHLAARSHRPSLNPSVQISRHVMGPGAGLHKPSLIPTVLQGPVDTGMASGVPSVAVRPMDHAMGPQSMWEPARGPVPWDTVGSAVAAVDPRQPGELMVSVQTMEKMIVQAVVVIQAYTRGYLVRSTIRVWHQCATVIQASWRGFRVRRNLARLYRATTIIQAAWRGYCTRRDCAQQMLLPAVWVELGGKVRATPDHRCFQGSEARLGSDHRCYQSCQPHICSLCQSLSPGLGSPPSVVMLVGSSPRTCHMCGHSLPTRVVHGMGRSVSSQGGVLWTCGSQKAPQTLCKSPGQNRAAMAIQSAWRGFKTRRQLRQQQSAAKMVQSNWRGHYTRSCLTTDMLLGSGAPRDCSRDASRHSTRSSRWPGV